MRYFVSYTDNKYELPQDGYNVFKVEIINTRQEGVHPSVRIEKIIIGGTKDGSTRMAADVKKLLDTREEVIQRIFEL